MAYFQGKAELAAAEAGKTVEELAASIGRRKGRRISPAPFFGSAGA
jgi:hypothetical protein